MNFTEIEETNMAQTIIAQKFQEFYAQLILDCMQDQGNKPTVLSNNINVFNMKGNYGIKNY